PRRHWRRRCARVRGRSSSCSRPSISTPVTSCPRGRSPWRSVCPSAPRTARSRPMRLRRYGRRRRSWPPSVTVPKSEAEEELMSEKLPYGTTMPTGEAAPEATAVPAETIAVITGGARGIGRHLSEAFAKAGYHVVVTATSAERAEATAVEILDATGAAVTGDGLRTDDIDSVKAFREAVNALEAETGRRVQVLINNAGRIESTEGPLWEADPESLKGVVDANVLGVALMLNAFAPVLISAAEATGRPSRIIDLNSGSG